MTFIGLFVGSVLLALVLSFLPEKPGRGRGGVSVKHYSPEPDRGPAGPSGVSPAINRRDSD